jgi:hypothetical protein
LLASREDVVGRSPLLFSQLVLSPAFRPAVDAV